MARTGTDRWWARKVAEVALRQIQGGPVHVKTDDDLDREGVMWWLLGERELADLVWRYGRTSRWPYPDRPIPRLRLFWWGRR